MTWFVWFVWFPNRITQDAKSVDLIKKNLPPQKNDTNIDKTKWWKSYKNGIENEDQDEACETYREGSGGARGLVPHSCRACHLWRCCVFTERLTVRTLVKSVKQNCGQTVTPGNLGLAACCFLIRCDWIVAMASRLIYRYMIDIHMDACILMWHMTDI